MAAPTYQTYARNVAVQPGQRLSFTAGRGYYAAPLPDPYQGIIAGLQRPMTNQQITGQARSEISPLVAAVTKQITGQTNAATHAIGGFSGDAAAKLAALDFGAPYQGAEQGQAAVDAALQQSLSGAGSSDANALASRLAVINDPTVAAAANTLKGNGAANGNTQLAQGSAALSNLIANAAAAKDYGLKQPGIQQLAGLQDIAAAEQAGTANIGSQTQQLEQQLPSIIQSLASQNDNRSAALTAARENQLARNDAINATAARNTTDVKVAKIKANEQAAASAKPNASLSRTVGYLVDSNGGWIPGKNGQPQLLPGYTTNASGQVVKAVKTGKATTLPVVKPLTAGQTITFLKGLATTKRVPQLDASGNTQLDSNGKVKYTTQTQFRMPYDQAYQQLRSAGKSDVQARKQLDTIYPKGQGGRAWLTNEQQHALRSASVPAASGVIDIANVGERHYITQPQVQALRAARKLPPGFWYTADQGHTVYVIKPGY
jgi:hypothetical protein